MSSLIYRERPAAGEPQGLLILHHGRGADEHDLLTLADVLDPKRRLHVVTPRAPLELPDSPGYHWYLVPRVGYPDPETFAAAGQALGELHDELWRETGIAPERTVLGGFSMGAVMSYAMALGAERPAPAGVLAFSGFIPTVEGWQPDLAGRTGVRVFIAHGRRDQVIPVDFAHAAAERLREAGLAVEYRESDAGHHIDPREIPAAGAWLEDTLERRA
ncbi:MAG TPA: phospholipase [Solirubrobacteraceae bacterium]|jgi:phospholipase/carboxylesterase|nr:phospholipase [Solirubrobacteraceae bacterium]